MIASRNTSRTASCFVPPPSWSLHGRAAGACLLLLGVSVSCGSAEHDDGGDCAALDGSAKPPPQALSLPPTGQRFDYQLDCPYALPDGVTVVSRDHGALPAAGAYNICYVNAFQTQPDSTWPDELILRDAQGHLVKDPDWDEFVLDITDAGKRSEIASRVGEWIRECSTKGFDAVELDNLDTYTRFGQRLSRADTIEYARALLDLSHARFLAVAQKNSAEDSATFRALGFDFVIAEECWDPDNEGDCQAYTAEYGERVFDIEYDEAAFERGCQAGTPPVPLLRDRDARAPGPDYVRRECP
jgi:hypothetical protein